jgi:hypothetical protein
MFLVLECSTGLVAIFTALSLSYSNDICSNLIPKSNKVIFTQRNYEQKLPVEMYSTSIIDDATKL